MFFAETTVLSPIFLVNIDFSHQVELEMISIKKKTTPLIEI